MQPTIRTRMCLLTNTLKVSRNLLQNRHTHTVRQHLMKAQGTKGAPKIVEMIIKTPTLIVKIKQARL